MSSVECVDLSDVNLLTFVKEILQDCLTYFVFILNKTFTKGKRLNLTYGDPASMVFHNYKVCKDISVIWGLGLA